MAAADRLDLYSALSKTYESLYVSYSYGDGNGELSPSPLVERLKSICPTCREKTDIESSDALPDCAAAALTLVAGDLRRFRDEKVCPGRLPALVEWLTARRTRELTHRMLGESAARFHAGYDWREAAKKLYGTRVPMSASRWKLQQCPFQHFCSLRS
jgi:ATP-dependent helicase/DNAse subunit B